MYGRKPVEWDTLAAWVVQNRLHSDNNLWMIQVPRLYNIYKEQGIIENFEQVGWRQRDQRQLGGRPRAATLPSRRAC